MLGYLYVFPGEANKCFGIFMFFQRMLTNALVSICFFPRKLTIALVTLRSFPTKLTNT